MDQHFKFARLGFSAGLFLAILVVTLSFVPGTARADGGAPNLAYVAGTSKGISVIDVAQQKVTSTIGAVPDPSMLQLSIDGRFLFTSEPSQGKVVEIAARTGAIVCTANVGGSPTSLALDSGTNVLYAAGSDSSKISAISTNDCSIQHTFQSHGNINSLAIAVVGSGFSGGNGNQLWIGDTSGITILDSSGKEVTAIPVPGGIDHLTIPLGTTVYAVRQQSEVLGIGLGNHQVLPALISDGNYGPMDYNAVTGEVYIPDAKNKQVDVLTPVDTSFGTVPREPRRVINLKAAPSSIAITSDGQLGFVAQQNGSITMLDIPGQQTITDIQVGGSPHFIITGVYPPALGTTPQQTSNVSLVLNIAAYLLVAILIAVPILLLLFNRKGRKKLGLKRKQ